MAPGSYEPTSAPDAIWDEAQCTAALAHLEQLQAQIDDLRQAIPRIIKPLQHPLSARTFPAFREGVETSQSAINKFSEEWKGERTQEVLRHVKKSLEQSGDLTAAENVPAHGWVERKKRMVMGKIGGEEGNVEDILTEDDVRKIVEEFNKGDAKVRVLPLAGYRTLMTQFMSGFSKLKFKIQIDREANGRHKLSAECDGTTEPFLAITRSLTARQKPNDLRYLLDMIAAYKIIKATSCAKCGQLLDRYMLTPTARRSRDITKQENQSETLWEALHESCLG